MRTARQRLINGIMFGSFLIISVVVAGCHRPSANVTTMAPIQRLTPSPTIVPNQPFIVGRPYSLDGSADGGDLIMISSQQFELIGSAQYAPIPTGSFDDITCLAIKHLPLTHPAGPIDIHPNMPLGFRTNHNLYAKVAFMTRPGTVAISAVIYPTC